jgi:hypothetical protein
MFANIASSGNLSTIPSGDLSSASSAIIETMPSWMSISAGETIGTDHPTPKPSLKKGLCSAGRAFKGFFVDHAKIYRG